MSSINSIRQVTLPIAITQNSSASRTGTFSSAKLGDGTFSTALTSDGDDSKTRATTLTLANGNTISTSRTTTQNSDGTTSVSTSRTGQTGKTVSKDLTLGAVDADGTRSVTGDVTLADGSVDTISGTTTKTADGSSSDISLTNADDQVATLQRETTVDANTYTTYLSGSNFNGGAIDSSGTFSFLLDGDEA